MTRRGFCEFSTDLEQMELNMHQTQQMMEDGQRSSSQQLQGVSESFHRAEDSQRQVEGQLLSLVAALQAALAQVQPSQLNDEQALQRKFNQWVMYYRHF